VNGPISTHWHSWYIKGNNCQQFWSIPFLSPFAVDVEAFSPICGDLCSHFHEVCKKMNKLVLGEHFKQIL
jgi:hypothetical protein